MAVVIETRSMQELTHLPWLIGGDSNEILLDTEKEGGRPRALNQMGDFQSTIDFCGVKYLPFFLEQFTWANK